MDYSKMRKAQLIEEIEAWQEKIAELDRAQDDRKRAEEALELNVEQLAALSQASQVVTASLELDQVLAEIVSLASEVVASDYTSVVLVDAAGNIGRSAENLPGVPGIEYRIRDKGLTRWIVHSRQAGVIDEIGEDGGMIPDLGEGAPRFANPPIVEAGVKSVAGLPLMVKDRLLGVLYLHSLHTGAFHGQLPLLTTFASQVAIAVDNARLYEALKQELAERKRAEEALRLAHRKLRAAFNAIQGNMNVVDLDFHLTDVNDTLIRVFGLPDKESILGRKCFEVLKGRKDICPYCAVAEAYRTKAPVYRTAIPEEEVLTGGRSFEIFAYPIMDEHGNLSGAVEFARDITERKRAEEALRESEERFRLGFEDGPIGMAIVGLDYRLLKVNKALCEMLGYTEQELTALTFVDITHPEDVEKDVQLAEKVFKGEIESYKLEKRYIKKNQEILWIDLTATVIRDQDRKALYGLAMIEDITERKRAEEELRQSYVKLQRTLEGTVNALVAAIEMRDPYTAGHQRRVTRLACAIAKEMDLTEEQIDGLRMAGLIHDLGKINVPAEILSKPSPLTELEYGLIKMHPQIGHDVLKTIEFPWPVAQIVLQHHERMDGSGYPVGLSGEEVILEARILGVADVVEAMASHRPYRAPRGIDKALEEISQNRGVLYHPEVVDACLKLFTEKGFKFA